MMFSRTSARWVSACGGPPMKRRTSALASIARMASRSSSVRIRKRRREVASIIMVLGALAPDQLGQVADQAHGVANEEAAQRRHAVDGGEADVTDQTDPLDVVGEQPV